METKIKDYYNYEYDEESFYDDDEDYDGSTSHDDLLDFIIDNLQQHGCKHHIENIEEFLTDFSDITLAEWCRDLMERSTIYFTRNYIEQLINKKYGIPTTTTPPINNEISENPMSSHEDETEEVPNDTKDKQTQNYIPILPPFNINYKFTFRTSLNLKKHSVAY